ncbi:DUF21 domain-containing protein At5g52790 isoform X1 [Rosa chinensis]|uniref:DUF21 domain-containing protein At5g52790 isoform X1 n=1 Tax=Rosa chinensis TaxID=74649 RepID=UPI000D08C4AF|nr:DUF21 domain-containing protein At5g52790 isoform X1 [Rosa chinensis]
MREDDVPCCRVDFWVFIVISLILSSLAGIASGLALGLLSFSKVDLEVLIRSGQPKDQKNAATILPLVKNEHLLLCTLLICKSLALEALPIFVDSILPVWAAILVSGTIVVAVTEIIPQAVCSRYGLSLGAKGSYLVRLLLVVFFPIAYPFSKLLDCLLGEGHSALLRRAELKTLVDMHANEAGIGGELSHHETTVIGGALDLTRKTAEDAMTPISETFSLDINSKLDMNTLGSIMSRGHSRIPIYSGNPNNIIGLILAKNLIFCRPEDETPVKYMTIRKIPRVYGNWPLYDILNQFRKGYSHMAAVVRNKKDVNGQKEKDARSSRLDSPRAESKDITGLNSPINGKEHLSNTIDTSPVYSSTDTEYCTALSEHVMEQDEDIKQMHNKRHKKQGGGNVSNESVGSIQSHLDEEVIGIITMEDVMEELLQEDILDETDEYVDVHNKIKINLLPSRRSSPSKSPRTKSLSQIYWRTPEPSPLPSKYNSPILRSPINPAYIQPPPFLITRPTLYPSPAKSLLNISSPQAGPFAGPIRASPSSHRASRKSYEKLRQPSGRKPTRSYSLS